MFKLLFESRFVPLVAEGLKRQTYRRGLHRPSPWQPLQLLSEDTLKPIIPDTVATSVLPLKIVFRGNLIYRICAGGIPVRKLEQWAIDDGFLSLEEMSAWHLARYGSEDFGGWTCEWSMPRQFAEVAA